MHHVGTADIDGRFAGALKPENSGMFEVTTEHTLHGDGLTEPRLPRDKSADSSHPYLDRNYGDTRSIESVNDDLVHQ